VTKGVPTSVTTETEHIRDLFEQVEEIEEVAETLSEDDHRRHKLAGVVDKVLRKAPPVRPVVAGELLDLTEKTVRAWAREGVLLVHSEKPRMLLDTGRLHEVLHLVAELRDAGRTRGLIDEVHRRLSDQALLEREDLTESLEQMNRSEGRVVRSA
jgi:DNA-binding transcriptional MerR regulator